MRYFIRKDNAGNASEFFRFDSTGKEIVEDKWEKNKWVDDGDMLVSKQLVTGDGNLTEVDKKTFDKWFPGASP